MPLSRSTFFDFIEEMNKFSTPCKPYYVSKNLGGCFDILNINSQERREVDKKLREVIDIREEMGEITFGLFGLTCGIEVIPTSNG